jgi:hypothetical protein
MKTWSGVSANACDLPRVRTMVRLPSAGVFMNLSASLFGNAVPARVAASSLKASCASRALSGSSVRAVPVKPSGPPLTCR